VILLDFVIAVAVLVTAQLVVIAVLQALRKRRRRR
jgi:hypothetical protein